MPIGLLEEESPDFLENDPQSSDIAMTDEERTRVDAGKLLQRTDTYQRMREESPKAKGIPEGDLTGGSLPESPADIIFPDEFDSIGFNVKPLSPEPITFDNAMTGVTTQGPPEGPDLDVSIIDFLFGGEMGIIGMKYDNEGFHWDTEIFKQQWSEQPVWINALNMGSLVGSIMFPAARAGWSAMKFGRGASLLNKMAGITPNQEVQRLVSMGLLDRAIKNPSEKVLRGLRQLENSHNYLQDLATKLKKFEEGEGTFTLKDKLRLGFARRFANNYWKNVSSISKGDTNVKAMFYNSLDRMFAADNMGRFFVNIPDGEEAGKKIMMHWMNKVTPGIVPGVKLSTQERVWADATETAYRELQQRNLKSGLISEETYKHVGEMHIPALEKGTPRPDLGISKTYYMPARRKATTKEVELGVAKKGEMVTVVRPYEMPHLDSPTLMRREKTLPEVAERLRDGKLITDQNELTIRGLMTDSLLAHNYETTVDIATRSEFATRASDIMDKFGSVKKAEKAGWISLDRLQGNIPTTLKRMVGKKDATWMTGDNLPFVRKAVFDDLFGDQGIFAQGQMASNLFEVMTIIHKTSKTALSPPTHMQNFTSNIAMLSQAGFNALAPENLRIGSHMAQTFEKIAKAKRAAADLGKPDSLADLAINLGKIKVGDRILDLTEEFTDPRIMDLIEESAFEQVEGFRALKRAVDSLRSEQRTTIAIGEGAIGLKKLLQRGDKEGFRWFDTATKLYLAEDMVPKMTYYTHLRGLGYSKDAAIIEVGRRLPMYNTVGSSIKQGRKYFLPWATFPTEAIRITKNNIMDNPLRMMPWLRAPQIVQSMLTMTGLAGDSEEVNSAKRQLPMWAQKHETVIAEEGAGGVLGGGLSGAVLGGVAGGYMGGTAGAYAGGAAGAALGALGAAAATDQNNADNLRGTLLDWLPHSSFLLSSTSPEFGSEIAPFKDMRGMIEQLPVEPLAILKPLLDTLMGRTAWGEEIGAEHVGEQMKKSFAGLIGFMAPPFIQKYGLKITSPDVAMSERFLGVSGGIPGDIFNVHRGLVDAGMAIDTKTGRPGNITHDMFLKNFGLWKSWATSAPVQMSNEHGTEQHLQQVRSYASKNLAHYLENNNERESMRILLTVMQTYSRQYAGDPVKAQQEYMKWIESKLSDLGKHPRLRGWSKEEILERLKKTSQFAAQERGRARKQMEDFMRTQIEMSQVQDIISKRKQQKKKERESQYSGALEFDSLPFGSGRY